MQKKARIHFMRLTEGAREGSMRWCRMVEPSVQSSSPHALQESGSPTARGADTRHLPALLLSRDAPAAPE